MKIYQVDAFANKIFGGNPAAVCPLTEWLSDDLLQAIAAENNLAETAFYIPNGKDYELRWFTPEAEVDLCGHATLAAAYVLFYHEPFTGELIQFHSPRSGLLTVTRNAEWLTLNFPTDAYFPIPLSQGIMDCFPTAAPLAAFKGKTDYMVVFDNEAQVKSLMPRYDAIIRLNARGVIATAPGDDVDFVSRFFAPQVGINEDPVTGSAHTTLTPYWSGRLGKTTLEAKQISQRGGHLKCVHLGDRVEISGQCKLYLVGEIFVL